MYTVCLVRGTVDFSAGEVGISMTPAKKRVLRTSPVTDGLGLASLVDHDSPSSLHRVPRRHPAPPATPIGY